MESPKSVSEIMYRSLMDSEKLPHEDLKVYCDGQRLSTLIHAANTTSFYKDRLQKFKDNPSKITLDIWNDIPVLTRADIQNNFDEILSVDIPKGHGQSIFGGTSGTSGMSILVKSTLLVGLMQGALQNRFFARMKFDGTRKLVSIIGDQVGEYPDGHTSSTTWISDFVFPTASGHQIRLRQPVALEKQLEFLNRQGPCYLNTQPSNLGGLGLEMLTHGEHFPNIDIAGVLCLGELLQPSHRKLAQSAFGCDAIDHYSASEVGSIAMPCADGHLHINSEALYVETLRDDGTPCTEHETGRIVITSTINWAMLLIRYDIGDRGALSNGCSCGSSLPVLKLTVGRERNLFKFSDGTSVLGLVSLAKYHEFFPAQQWQIAQTGPEELTVRFVSQTPNEHLDFDRLRTELQTYFNRPLTIEFSRQKKMVLTASGKLQEAVRESF